MAGVNDAIVEMKFDNALFEQKLNETIRSLDKLRASLDFSTSQRALANLSDAGRKLDKGLDFSTAKKSMYDLDAASKKVSMEGLGRGIEDVSRKFLAMSTIAITALSQITSHAVNAGIGLVKAFTFDPIIAGFQEMETNMNSIQTILANTKSKGSTLAEVEASLTNLNTYSDKTIYNFSQMARNIGTFTAAGVGLDDSVNAIKGIANLAAISGSSSEQASTAMYQLSQALAAGKVNLMDWNSVVNAGMGGEIFKKSLFETGKALGTIKDIPLGASFEEWEKKGGTFREQMQKGWITADVLKTTLGAFSGDLDVNALKLQGFSQAAAEQLVETGKMGLAAATEVKTFTQLIGTVKEAIGTGFADSFKILVGNFEEAKTLFTSINTAIGNFVGNMADARNNLLGGWKLLGGRQRLIQGFKDGFAAIGNVLKAVSKAFHDIFPPKTSKDLVDMTVKFADLTQRFKELTIKYLPKITRLFRGFFAGFEIGLTVVKEVVKLIKNLLLAILPAGGAFAVAGDKAAGFMSKMNNVLVAGGGIADFFEKLTKVLVKPLKIIGDVTAAVLGFFGAFKDSKGAESGMDRISKRFDVVERITSRFKMLGTEIKKKLDEAFNHIKTWVTELGQKLADEIGPGDFNKAVDLVNVGLLGGILLILRKFVKQGINIDFGGGVIGKITKALDGVTETLKAMEANVKADAILKIAGAMAILAASMLVLSLIDSDKLAQALTAITVGLGQLIGTLTIITKLSTNKGALKFTAISIGFIALAAAMLVLSIAIKILSTMTWDEIARGLAGVAGGMTVLVTAIQFMAGNTAGLVRAGLSIIFISVGLAILAGALKIFATMTWDEIGKGMAAVAGGLTALVAAMNLIPKENMIQAALGIIGISVGLAILAGALKIIATMSWEDIAKGLVAIVVALAAIVLLTNTMPIGGFVAIGAGLILVGVAMNLIAKAVESMGALKGGDLAKGLAGLAVAMLILVVATKAMESAIGGAIALVIVSGALTILAGVIKILGTMPIAQLITGIIAIAFAIGVIVGAAALLQPFLGSLLALGAGMLLVAASFAIFGLGLVLIGKGLESIGSGGVKGVRALMTMVEEIIKGLPRLVGGLAAAFIGMAQEILDALPLLVDAIKVLLGHILDTIVELAPKFGETFVSILSTLFDTVQELFPKFVELGVNLIIAVMTGIRDNIKEIIELGSDIIIQFLEGMSENDDQVIEAAVNMLTSFLTAIAEHAAEIALAGYNFLLTFIEGIVSGVEEIIIAAVNIITEFLRVIGEQTQQLIDAGVKLITDFLIGVAQGALEIAFVVTKIITTFITELGAHAEEIVAAGTAAIVSFLEALTGSTDLIAENVGIFITNLIDAIAELADDVMDAGTAALLKFLEGLRDTSETTMAAFRRTGIAIMRSIADNVVLMTWQAIDVVVDFLNGLAAAIESGAPRIRSGLRRLGLAIIEGMVTILVGEEAGNMLKAAAEEMAGMFLGPLAGPLGFDEGSPSKKTMKIGKNALAGLADGLSDSSVQSSIRKTAFNTASGVTTAMEQAFNKVNALVPVIEEINPVITPILDLTQIKLGAQDIDKMMATARIGADISIERARTLALTTNSQNGSETETPVQPVTQEITFNQTINAPEALSTNDIYRSTKSQIVLAKEELKIA